MLVSSQSKPECSDILGCLGLNLKSSGVALELNRLLYRVAETYGVPSDYVNTLNNRFSCSVEEAMFSRNRFRKVLRKYQPEQVIAIANCGLPLGALAAYMGYDVRIIEAHRKDRSEGLFRPLSYARNKAIEWRDSNPEGIFTLGNSVGILDVDDYKSKEQSVVVDECSCTGATIGAVVAHLKERDVKINKIVLVTGFPNYLDQSIKSKVVSLWNL